jgi:hypothetical protein
MNTNKNIVSGSATEPKTSSTNDAVNPMVEGYRSPSVNTLQHIYKLSVTEDKPIMFDYWTSSLDKTSIIGVKKDTNEKLLVKSDEEYTSPISRIFKVTNEYIIVTENSIYVVDVDIPRRLIEDI